MIEIRQTTDRNISIEIGNYFTYYNILPYGLFQVNSMGWFYKADSYNKRWYGEIIKNKEGQLLVIDDIKSLNEAVKVFIELINNDFKKTNVRAKIAKT